MDAPPFSWLRLATAGLVLCAFGAGRGAEAPGSSISLLSPGVTFQSLADCEFRATTFDGYGLNKAILRLEVEIRSADGKARYVRIPCNDWLGNSGFPKEALRRMGTVAPGEYRMAILADGVRASNVIALRIDPAFDVAKAPTFEMGVLENPPGGPGSRPILWTIGPTPPDKRISNISLLQSLVVDGTARVLSAFAWTGPVGLIRDGDRSYTVPSVFERQKQAFHGYTPPFDGGQPHSYGFAMAERVSNTIWVDPKLTPMGDAWDSATAAIVDAPRPPAIVQGTVLDREGQPAAGYRVMLTTPVHAAASETTDDRGRYRFSGSLPAGAYSIKIVSPKERQVAEESFRLGEIKGEVRDFDLRTAAAESKVPEPKASPPGLRYIDLEKVEKTVGQGLDPNQRAQDGNTPLSMAALTGRAELVKKLVEAGADVNAAVGTRSTILGMAIAGGNREIFEYLLSKGADVNKAFPVNGTPLLEAARLGRVEMTQALVERGADVRATNSEGANAVALAAQNGHAAIVSLLARQGADLELTDKGGRTPLMHAAMAGQPEAAKALLAGGAKIDFANQDGFTALYQASCGRDSKRDFAGVVKELLAAGADPNIVTVTGDTPLTRAVAHGSAEMITMLVKGGADLRGAPGRKAMEEAIRATDASSLAALLESGADPDQEISYHMPALEYAIVMTKNASAVETLVKHGANVNAVWPSALGNRTPLIVAAMSGKASAVKTLLEAGARRDFKDDQGRTALDLAREGKKAEVMKLLAAAEGAGEEKKGRIGK